MKVNAGTMWSWVIVCRRGSGDGIAEALDESAIGPLERTAWRGLTAGVVQDNGVIGFAADGEAVEEGELLILLAVAGDSKGEAIHGIYPYAHGAKKLQRIIEPGGVKSQGIDGDGHGQVR